ncbi:hypothetical protein BDZ94DRAFT_1306917 [Collybia nuda]|uniref:Uncharacterized protein n=1 Tax=Collybia nuda TaxID=64659 RepID=A0A9P6CMB9_9AGAR|nr:hypothetical protein BDZ94DRAFT_1306917 [Collybia nuda]
MVALNQQFTVLATFCSLAAISMFSLSANAVAIQGRSPSGYISSAVPFHDDKHKNSYEGGGPKGKQHEGRTFSWPPINNAIRMADMAISSVRHSYSGASAKRDRHEAQAHFRSHGVNRREKPRPSVIVPNDKGGSYLVSPGRRSLHAGQSKATKRGEPKGTAGRVNLMSPTNDPSKSRKLGSLVAQEEPESHAWFLAASEDEYMPMYLVKASPGVSSLSISSREGSDVPVSVQVPSNSSESGGRPLCATIDGKGSPLEPQHMIMKECFGEKSNERGSQMFVWDEKTGVINPIGGNAKSDDPTTPTKAGVASVTNVTDGRDGTGEPTTAKNVTLVFVPDSDAASAEEDTTTATSTMTTTITVTNVSTATASVSAADVEPTSTAEASPPSSSALSSPATASPNTESSMPASASVTSAAAFNVQVIGSNNTSSDNSTVASTTLTSDSAVPTKSMTAQDVGSAASVTATSDSTVATTTIKAADVAASIAASGISSSAAPASTAINDTSSTTVPTVAAVGSPVVSDTESPPAATVTSVNTGPYQMMFKADNRL